MPITRDIKAKLRSDGVTDKSISYCLIALAELMEDLEQRIRKMGQITIEGLEANKALLQAMGVTHEMLDVVGDSLGADVTAKLKRFKDPNVSVGSESLPVSGDPTIASGQPESQG